MPVIDVNELTKDYGHGRGVFGVSLKVEKGECYGFLGPNGAGKTTTIRHLMGFLKPDRGTASVMGIDSWKRSIEIKPFVGYVPGEIAFPNLKSGTDFLKLQAEYLGVRNCPKITCASDLSQCPSAASENLDAAHCACDFLLCR